MARKLDLKRLLTWTVGLLAVLAVAVALRPQPVPVDLARVERGELVVTLDEEGETRVRERFVVSAPLAGKVLRIELEPGDEVRAGETVLATFEPRDPALLDARTRARLEAEVKAAREALGAARAERDRLAAEHAFARSELDRYRRLAAADVVARNNLEMAERDERAAGEQLEAAVHALARAEREVEAARARLLDGNALRRAAHDGTPVSLPSPIDGVVLKRLRESETVVAAGEPLLELGNPAQLEIVADYLSADAVRIRPGMAVLIEQWGGDAALRGRVKRVEPSGFTKISALGVEEQRVNVVIDFEDPRRAWQALGDGYRVETRVVVYRTADAVKVPTSSLFRAGEDWALYAVEDGRAVLRRLELGPRNGLEAEVASGIDEGALIIVHPSDDVAGGVKVEPRGEGGG
ncbi:MAG: HlyD family efflux transporter periplasmic adaptor subunit [Acidobacteria bacterium]|nr:MAG: HlyD family efflux transporter periplasmic adaptor subunit [Acidobacteriota bacterium]